MRGFAKLFVANFRTFRRDTMAAFWTLAFPVIFILLFGAIFSKQDSSPVNIGLVVEDRGAAGTGLTKAFTEVPVFVLATGERDAEMAALKTGKVRAVVVIPQGMTEAIDQGKTSPVEVYYDSTQQMASQIVLTAVNGVLSNADHYVRQTQPLFQVTPKPVVSTSMRNIDFLVPGILGMALMQLGLFSTAQPLIALRQQQVLRRLGATPLPRSTLLASQVSFRALLALLQAIIIVVVGRLAFGVQMVGNWGLLFGVALLGGLMFVGLGYLIASISRTEESGMAISQLVNFPMMFLSGIFFPVETMPGFLRPVMNVMPLSYLGDALRQIMVGATAVHPLTTDLAVLGAWLLACLLLSVRFFRWE